MTNVKDKPWEHEPDYLMFMSDAGYVCEIKRHPDSKHLNGYIYIPEGHSDFGKDYHDLHGYSNGAFYEDAPASHGGWTYAETRGDEDGGKHTVFGFDCNHARDYAPGTADELAALNIEGLSQRFDTYRTIEYVTNVLEQAAHDFKRREKGEQHALSKG